MHAFYDKPTKRAKLLAFYDGSKLNIDALEVGAEWVGEYVEIISEKGNFYTVRSEKGSIFKDVKSAFTVVD